MPTPVLSFSVRELGASCGIMITASHNPKEYNGYKVYGSDGCQITTEAAKEIQGYIKAVDLFDGIKQETLPDARSQGLMEPAESIIPSIYDRYIEAVLHQSVLFGDNIDTDVSIVYTPLNGTGRKPVADVLRLAGYTNITVVSSQEAPDGTFPTCPKPNPEEPSAMDEGLKMCQKVNADLLIATDPDADRCGIAVKDTGHSYRLLTANETGILLLDYICRQRATHGHMTANPVFMKTIVTNDLAAKIASHYEVETVNVLTGFKFIGEKIGELQDLHRTEDFIFGFEESYGYLTGTYARDKGGVLAAYLIAEMFSYYRTRGISLLEKLDTLYATFGYCLNTQHTYQFEGSAGMARMEEIMTAIREQPWTEFGGQHVEKAEDFDMGLYGLPRSNVLKFYTKDCSVVIRPSGTEPKLKVYISVTAENSTTADRIEKDIANEIDHHCLR